MAKVVTIRSVKRVIAGLLSDERGGFSFTMEGEQGSHFLPLVLMIWGATPSSTVCRIECANRLCMLGNAPIPAELFGAAKSLEELHAQLTKQEEEDKRAALIPPPPASPALPAPFSRSVRTTARPYLAGPSWIEFSMMWPGERLEVQTRGPITAIALLGKRYTPSL